MTSAQITSFRVETHLSARVVPDTLVDVDTVERISWIRLESVSTMTVVAVSDVCAQMFTTAIVSVRLTGLSILLG